VISFAEDVQAPPQDGEELAGLIPNSEFTCSKGWDTARGTAIRTTF